MITTERLEELIKQGAVIYYPTSDGILEIDLSNGNLPEIKYGRMLYVHVESSDYRSKLYIGKLFETKEQAEWVLKTTAERTERFEPPMWEDIEDHYGFDFISNGMHYYLAVYKHKDCNEIDVGEICGNTLFARLATKENYIKACEIVRDLFNKGGV